MDLLGKVARERGLETAQQLLAAVVKAGSSRHGAAAAAAALWRLGFHPSQAAASRDEEAAVPAQCFRLLEEALEAVRLRAGGG